MSEHATAGWILLALIVAGVVGYVLAYAYIDYRASTKYRRDITMKPGLWRPNERRRIR